MKQRRVEGFKRPSEMIAMGSAGFQIALPLAD
jgi:hypothetical protein